MIQLSFGVTYSRLLRNGALTRRAYVRYSSSRIQYSRPQEDTAMQPS